MNRALIAAIAAVSIAAAVHAQPHPTLPGETVSISGTGRVTVTPDRFTFTVGVQTVAATVEQAVNENNERVASTIAALKRAGATDREIRTSNFAIWPQQDYSQQGKLPRILGYQVSNNITVTRDKVGEAGKLLQVAVNAGVNQSSGLQFEVSDPAKGRDQGLTAAYADARAKAVLLAQAAGRTLGRALIISEGNPQVPVPPPYMPRAMKAEAAVGGVVGDVPVESGAQEQVYTVSVVFELR